MRARLLLLVCVSLLGAALSPSVSFAQQSTAQQSATPVDPSNIPASDASVAGDGPITTLRVQANEVNLVFSVTDKKGRFVTGLKQEDFDLSDNKVSPESILRFRQQTDLPLRVGLMLDTSSSIMSRFKFEQDAATEFLRQTLRRGRTRPS